MLSQLNSHPRDSKIIFDEGPHIYTILDDPNSKYTSCTTFIHHLFEPFNADAIIDKMMKSSNWTQSKYFGKSKNEIKSLWDQNRIIASTSGTNMHKNIEMFMNSEIELSAFDNNTDMKHFVSFYNNYGNKLKSYRSEWMIYDTDLKLAGSIDYVVLNDDQTLDLYDWKRSTEIKKENRWQSGKYPLQHIPDCNYWHYSLQLNLYKALLEKNYQKKIRSMYLVILHPNFEDYQILQVPDLSNEIKLIFDHRLEELYKGSTKRALEQTGSTIGFEPKPKKTPTIEPPIEVPPVVQIPCEVSNKIVVGNKIYFKKSPNINTSPTTNNNSASGTCYL